MTDQHTAANHPPQVIGGPRTGATVTVTLRDGRTVTTSTWSTCVGVGRFVVDLLGTPTARHTATHQEVS